MARLKRSSTVLEAARKRLSGLKTFKTKPNFGPTLDLDQYEQEINDFSAKLDEYNDTLSQLDRLQNDILDAEGRLNDKNKRMLAATGAYYGPDSNEYETAGGTRASERKRPTRKKTGTGSTPAP